MMNEYTETVFPVNGDYTDTVIQPARCAVHYTGMSFTSNLVRLRTAKGWPQEKLAEVVGVSQVTISRWETAEREPRGKLRAKLAQALGVEEAALFDQAYSAGGSGREIDGAVPVHQIPVLGDVPAGNWRGTIKSNPTDRDRLAAVNRGKNLSDMLISQPKRHPAYVDDIVPASTVSLTKRRPRHAPS